MSVDYLFMDENEAINIALGPVMAVPTTTWREVVHVLSSQRANATLCQLTSIKLAIRKIKDYDLRKINSEFVINTLIDNLS